jgi:hypothetical protein
MSAQDHLTKGLSALIAASTDDFLELARISGLDPKRDFRHADLSGADLRGFDLTAFDLSSARLNGTLLAGAKLNDTVSRSQLEHALLELPVACFFIGRRGGDAGSYILDDLGPRFRLGGRTADAVEDARRHRDRMLHLSSTRVRNPADVPNFKLEPEVLEKDVSTSSAALVIADVRNRFDADVLTSLLDGLAATDLPCFVFAVTESMPRVSKTVRTTLDNLIIDHGRNMMISVGGTPIASRAALSKTLPAAVQDSVDIREVVAFLVAWRRSRNEGPLTQPTQAVAGRPADRQRPVVLLATMVRPHGTLLGVIQDAWMTDLFTREGAGSRGVILVDENFYRKGDIAELLKALPKMPVQVRVFPASVELDSLYVVIAQASSGLWPLLKQAGGRR